MISDDLDPVSGFLVFHIGAPKAPPQERPAARRGDADGPSAARIAAFVLLVLLASRSGGAGVHATGPARRCGRRAAPWRAGGGRGGDGDRRRGSAAAVKPFRASVKMGTLDSRVAIRPARVGWNRIELELPPPTGTEGGYFEVRVWASLESAGLGPMQFAGIQGTELNSFAVRRAYLPLPGSWKLRVSARRGVSGRYATTLTVPVPAR